ncbi:hypothetical protein [Limnohabitans sp. Rim8]|uniref:hypothetical protein n=1 Tax=Limnohabitans sp. Rim8 TaxID=1100718 RepID=UPI0033057C8D
MPEPVRERLQEIAITINLVAKVFGGDVDKTVTWFKTRNPLLGDISPRDMVRLGRFERLRKFILASLQEVPKPFLDTKLKMSDAAYDILLDTGINISPLPVWLDEWEHPETYVNPALLANIAREGVRV